jgi:quercetin dioxygenase-like cupin family protein
MSEPIATGNAEHYLWGGVCDGWHLVKQDALSVIQERMPPGASEQRHFHRSARQFFYVLEGELTLEVEGQTHVLRSGTGLEITPGERHQACNRSGADVAFLVISSPPSHGDRVSG